MGLVNPLPKWKDYAPVVRGSTVLYAHGDGRFFMPAGVPAMAMEDGTVTAKNGGVVTVIYPKQKLEAHYQLASVKTSSHESVLRGQPIGTARENVGLPVSFRREGRYVDPATVLEGLPVLRDPRQRTLIAITGFVGAGLLAFKIWRDRQ